MTKTITKAGRPTILLDCNNLAHAAFHALGSLAHKGAPTQVIYGFLTKVAWLSNHFRSLDLVFCFDFGFSKREEDYPEYKAARKKFNERPDIAENRKVLFAQMDDLRKRILKQIGFANIIWAKGYEADDLIAAIVQEAPTDQEFIIVSSDKDMYQLLTPKVSIWNNRMPDLYRVSDFYNQFDVPITDWKMVKAIAGCTSDGVEGIQGVGEVTAIKYLKNQLKKTTKAWHAITSTKGKEIIKRNLLLVELPYKGTPNFYPGLTANEVTIDKWVDVGASLGMSSLKEIMPFIRHVL